jgi:outer membrane receptor protein involved in Fe transport
VEVIKGPASSVYGSEAIGGAVNFITQAPSYTPTAKIGLHGDGWNYRRVQFSASNFVTRKLGVFLGGYCARQRNGWQGNSDFDKLSLNLRADYFLKEGLKLVGSFSTNHLHTQTGGSLDSTGFYSRSYNTLHTFTYRKADASRARLSLQKYWSSGGESGLTAFGRSNRIGQLPNYSIRNVATDKTRANGEINENTFRSYGLTAQHVQPLAWLAGKLIGGVYADLTPSGYRANYIAVDRDPNTGQYVSYTNRPDSLLTDYRADLLNTAAYAQVEWNPVPTLRVVAGLRYDRLDYRYDNHLSPAAFSGAPDDKNRFQFVTPKIGITYNLAEGRGLYANTSVGAYAPGINELYRGVKVPVLQPARFDNYEAGGWMTLLDGALQAEVSLYQMNGRREIVSYLLSDHSTENRNSGRTLHQGVEYSLNYAPGKQWALRLSGTNARHRYIAYSPKEGQTYNGKSMPNAPAWIANAEVTCKPAVVPGLRLGLEWQRVGSWYKDDNNDYRYEDRTLLGLRGVSVLHLRAGYAFGGFEVYANVTNLTDELYAQNVSRGPWGDTFSPAAGRTVAAGVHYTFKGKEKSRE